MNKVLVTGADGFLGRRLLARLSRPPYGFDVIALNRENGDVADPQTFRGLGQAGISRVFHFAGRTYVPDSWADPIPFLHTNVLGTACVLEFCRDQGIPLTHISAYVYGKPQRLPINEDDPVNPNNPYALSKYMAENVCGFYANVYGLPVTVIRLFNIFGAGQDPKFLVPRIIRHVLFEEEIVVEDLAPRRDYIFIEDFLDALMLTFNCRDGYRIYNIGSGYSMSVGEVIDAIQKVAGTKKRVVCNNAARLNEIDDVVADNQRAKNELGWVPKFSFSQGIAAIIEGEKAIGRGGPH